MNRDFLPYVPLADEDKKRFHAIMVAGSAALGRCVMSFYNKDNRSSRIEFLELLFGDMLDRSAFPPEDIAAIFAIREIEAQLLMGYVRSLRKIVQAFLGSHSGDTLRAENIIDVAEDYARLSMYFFDDRGTDYHTFMVTMVRNALKDLIRTRTTRDNLAKFFCHSQIPREMTRRKQNLEEVAEPAERSSLYSDKQLQQLHEAIEKAKLTEVERELMDAYLTYGDPKQGSKEKGYVKRIMGNHINERTGRPFSTQQGFLLMQRAKQKVADTFNQIVSEVA